MPPEVATALPGTRARGASGSDLHDWQVYHGEALIKGTPEEVEHQGKEVQVLRAEEEQHGRDLGAIALEAAQGWRDTSLEALELISDPGESSCARR